MCIIVHQPAEKFIDKKILENCWNNNLDGAGLCYAHKGKIYIHKELVSFEAFYNFYKNVWNLVAQESDIILHFRNSLK